MPQKRISSFRLAIAAGLFTAAAGVADERALEGWVWPTYGTSDPVEKQITVVDRYRYREQGYTPPVSIRQAAPRAGQRFGTPEEAMITRVSAMMRQDYDGWLETWDEESRQLTIENNEAMGRTADYFLSWWSDAFQFAHFTLVRRIETGPYVVITYRLLTPAGEDAGNGIEFPTIFRQVENRWLATLDLREDPLVPASPWVSGESRMEVTVR